MSMILAKGTFSVVPINMLSGLNPYIQVIFVWLCHHANQDGLCFPSLKTLSLETAIKKTSLIKYLKELEKIGHITKQVRPNHVGDFDSNLYTIRIYEPGEVVRETHQGSSRDAPGVVRQTDNNYNHIELKSFNNKHMSISPPKPSPSSSANADRSVYSVNDLIIKIFDYWKTKFKHPKAKLDGNRKRKIQAMLKLGYSFDDICLAIDGCSITPHNMGKNTSGVIYDDIELICRDAKHLERFRENALNPPSQQNDDDYVW